MDLVIVVGGIKQMNQEEIFKLADELKERNAKKDELNAELKSVTAEIADIDEKLTQAMTDAELDKFTRNGSTFYLKSRLFASPVAEHKPEFLQALKDNDCGNLITEQVNANTLASWVKEYNELHGTERPEFLSEELLNIYTKVSVGIRKS